MNKIPKYKSLRILLVSAIFYFFLIMPFLGFMFMQNIPKYMDMGLLSSGSEGATLGPIRVNPSDNDSTETKNTNDSILKQNTIPLQNPLLAFADSDPLLNNGHKGITSELDGRPNETSPTVINEFMRGFEEGSNLQRQNKILITDEDNPGYIATSFDIFFYGTEIVFVITLLISLPFKRYFRRKRKGKETSARLEFLLRRYLLYTPIIHAGLFGAVSLVTVGYISYIRFFVD